MPVEILTPSSRAEWLSLRGATIGASESPALFGIHPWLSAYELHHLKAGTIAADQTETGPMRRGRPLEEVAVKFLQEERPAWAVRGNIVGEGGRFYRDVEAGLSCTPDAFVIDPEREGTGICQIKSVEPSVYRSRWRGDDGQVEVPLYVAVQAVQEAFLTGATWAVVCPLVIGFSIEMPVLEVPLHRGLTERLISEVGAFWRGIRAGTPPDPDYAKDGALLERFWAGAGEEVDLSSDNEIPALVAERERLSAEKGAAEKRLKEIKTQLFAKLGNAAFGRLGDGRLLTAKRVTRGAYSVEASSYVDLKIKGKAA
jgi:hypothetical protein